MNIAELLTIANAIVPNRTAIVYENRRITYQQMLDRVNRLANALSYYGVSPGDRVAMLQVNCNEHIEACFAAAKLDAVYVPINFRSRAQEIAYMLNDSAPLVLIAGSRYIDLIQPIMGTLKSVKIAISLEKAFPGWLCYEDLLASFTGEERVPQGDGDDLTMLMFTAGTTGSPKAVKSIMATAKESGARMAVELNVSGAFHSPHMTPACEPLAEKLSSLEIQDSIYPVFTNVAAKPVTTSPEIKDALIQQLENPVLWAKSILNMKLSGLESFFEIGPGKVLQGLNKRIDRQIPTSGIESLDQVEAFHV